MVDGTLGIVRGRTAAGALIAEPGGPHPKARLRTDDDVVLELPYAPRGAKLGGWAQTFQRVDRPGRDPLNVRTGGSLPTLGLTVFLGYTDHQVSVEPLLAQLRAIAESGTRVTLINLSVQERGPWQLEAAEPLVELRQHGTNHATRATIELTFVAASRARVRLGPVTGGKSKGKGKLRKGESRYTVKQGDTLAKIADAELSGPGDWRKIARRNKIKRPDSIRPGDVLIIPDED